MRTFPTPVLPRSGRPRKLAELATAERYLRHAGVDLSVDQVVALFVRAYFLDEEGGDVGRNDHNTYDDAAVICRIRGGRVVAVWTFNANTDARAEGQNPDGRGWPSLLPGVHEYRFGFHRDRYLAIKPFTAVRIVRDGSTRVEHNASINGHAGGDTWTWSEGCLTIHHAQYGPQTKSLTRRGEGFIDRLFVEAAATRQGASHADGAAVFAALKSRTGERPVTVAVVDEAAFRAAQ